MEYRISVPASEEELKKLRAGDSVLLSGTVYTARDAAHKRICECFDNGEPAPFARRLLHRLGRADHIRKNGRILAAPAGCRA